MLIDFALVVIPLQLMLTWFNNIIIPCFVIVLTLILLLVIVDIQTKPLSDVSSGLSLKDIPMSNSSRPFVTYFRAFTSILTAFSILAVDFKLFPRHLGKTETYGTGLMDVGVGCFLVANAIVSPEARQKVSPERYTELQIRGVFHVLKSVFDFHVGVEMIIVCTQNILI